MPTQVFTILGKDQASIYPIVMGVIVPGSKLQGATDIENSVYFG